jgi:HlyD family type I secretion membrane fusion protein
MAEWSSRPQLLQGLTILLVGLGGFIAWALFVEIRGAVVAPGEVMVAARRQALQHPDGGVVAAIHVKDAQTVAAGTPILTLDGTELEAQRAVNLRARAETLAQLDRLLAEVTGAATVSYRPALLALRHDVPEFDQILSEETALFAARQATLRQTTAQLDERILQARALIGGREKQLTASREQIALIREELAAQQALLAKGLTSKPRVLALQRGAARFVGDIGEIEAGIAEARSSIAGYEVERLRLIAEFREKAQAEMRTLQPREAELREQLRVIDSKMRRLTLRAPMAGAVLGLQTHTVGGVIPPAQEIGAIVPSATPLILMVDVDPRQIDRVHAGQKAMVRFPNFDQRTTPEVEGHVLSVSADAMMEPQTGRRFFRAEVGLAPGAEAKLGGNLLLPGMPVEALIQTDARTPASFLLKPLSDYWSYAMREE